MDLMPRFETKEEEPLMQSRLSVALGVATALLVVACCGPAATTAPTTAPPTLPRQRRAERRPPLRARRQTTEEPDRRSLATEATADDARAPSEPAGDWVIGVVTDVGPLNDKNFNEYTYKAQLDAATELGADEPAVGVPRRAPRVPVLSSSFFDDGHNIIVTIGFNLTQRHH